jgi:CDP-glucose 4,6-dehydratase
METPKTGMSRSLTPPLADLRATLAGRRVFVTGHTGFKGSWLCLWLQRLGATVAGYALEAPTDPNLFAVASVGKGMQSIIGDIRDGERLAGEIVDFRPEIVFHLAAQPLVRLSYDDPVATYATNVMGSVHLLEALRHVDSVRAAVIVSSDKCYDNPSACERYEGFRETDPMGGDDPYSSSKGCTELLVHSYRHSFFHPKRTRTSPPRPGPRGRRRGHGRAAPRGA